MRARKEFMAKVCVECRKRFETRRESRKYCSDHCRWVAWERGHPRVKVGDIPPEPEFS
jgi:hypothetical protein